MAQDPTTRPLAVWLDTVMLPRFGGVSVRSHVPDFHGNFTQHGHMKNHEERGMMQVVEVDGEG